MGLAYAKPPIAGLQGEVGAGGADLYIADDGGTHCTGTRVAGPPSSNRGPWSLTMTARPARRTRPARPSRRSRRGAGWTQASRAGGEIRSEAVVCAHAKRHRPHRPRAPDRAADPERPHAGRLRG